MNSPRKATFVHRFAFVFLSDAEVADQAFIKAGLQIGSEKLPCGARVRVVRSFA
jgi:hypothetical protein